MSKVHEHTLNVWLTSHLTELGLDATPEVKKPGNLRIDVEIILDPAVIALEAEHGQGASKKKSAIKDADARLKQGLADCAVAVCYPDNTTYESLPSAQLLWLVRTHSSTPSEKDNWTTGSITQLASAIRHTKSLLGDPDNLAKMLSSSLDLAVSRLTDNQKQDMARELDLPAKPQSKNRKNWNPAAKRAFLVIATAIMFHARLDRYRDELKPELDNRTNPPEPFQGNWPPEMAHHCADSTDPIQSFADAWDLILALDYQPIFQTARVALLSCSNDAAFTTAIQDCARAALKAVRSIAGLRHDLLGRIFHTVLDTARYDGSFYTTTAAAALLATLAIDDKMCDWRDSEAISRLRIVDPACGTGTLLMAAAERIRELSPHSTENESVSEALIEQVLSGYDVNLTATHLAATTLGLLSPTTQFSKMKIFRALLGIEDKTGVPRLGSLELLKHQPFLMPWPEKGKTVTQIDTEEEADHAELSDLVIMNPPFTRDSLRHKQFSTREKNQLKGRERFLFENAPVHLSSNANTFLFLAEHISKKDTGVIAAVLPLVTATNASSLRIRRFLAEHYHIETIITSHDPERIYFSENTSISEMLLICRRWNNDADPKPATRIINLAENPESPSSAIPVANAIRGEGGVISDYGTLQVWPQWKIAAGDWSAVQFLLPYLCQMFASLKTSKLFPTNALALVSEIGPAGQGVRENFKQVNMPDELGRVALWDHKTERIQSMLTTWDTYINAKPAKVRQAERNWTQRGTFLLPQRLRLNTVRSLSVRLDTPVVGSAWMPCRFRFQGLDTEILEMANCVYLNSTIGILAMLGDRSNRALSYPHFSVENLRSLAVPNFTAIGKKAADALAETYVAHAEDVLLPLPQMKECPVRRSLDEAVIASLDLDAEVVATIRHRLASEPSITNERYSMLQSAQAA